MASSKSIRIMILLAIDIVFFMLEISVGYTVHSLALVADSFHMLNDVISLLVGLWAVRVAQNKGRSSSYTYGWQRAETLGALINGVFLVALCLSIVLDAVQRFFEPQEVKNPLLVLIVGCCGLASNILGLFLFGHSHGHGGEEHDHSHDEHSVVEEGHGHSHGHGTHTDNIADESRGIEEVLPAVRVGTNQATARPTDVNFKEEDLERDRKSKSHGRHGSHSHGRSRSRAFSNIDDVLIHPASFRNEIINYSKTSNAQDEYTDTESEGAAVDEEADAPTETTSLLSKSKRHSHSHAHHRHKSSDKHRAHHHSQPKEAHAGHGHSHGAGGHSHDDLNMRGIFLHVLGDALGNVGVILSALFIWKTDFSWRFYADPVISLIITLIILHTAVPLCKAAARILLQAVPEHVDVDELKEDIESLDGVYSAHHIHVWQLSDKKLIASLHIQVNFNFRQEGSQKYMQLAKEIRRCLHGFGIHSSTIQPEFFMPGELEDSGLGLDADGEPATEGSRRGSGSQGQGSRTGSVRGDCLLGCDEECDAREGCCPPNNRPTK